MQTMSTPTTESSKPLSLAVIEEFRQLVGGDSLIVSENDRRTYECDGYSLERAVPSIVVLPNNRDELLGVVKLCRKHNLSFVPRGAGTSLSGGTIPLEHAVIIGLTKMNKILEIHPDDGYAVVEPGVVNVWLTNRLSGTGLHYAPDPSSQGACTIGGNVATNSGGPHTLKYGVTVNHVLGVEMIMPDGSIAQFGGPADEYPGIDLVGLTVGCEGTFGICSKVWVRLTRNAPSVRTLLAIFDTVDSASDTISAIIAAGIIPAALEMMDKLITRAVEEAYGFGFPLDAEAVLIIEVDGLEAGIDEQVSRIEQIAQANGAREVRRAQNEAERQMIWKCRKKAFGAIGRLSPSYCCQDGVVPRTQIPTMLRFINEVSARHDIRIANVFHAGDGNMHPILLFDERFPEQTQRVVDASHEILAKCLELGGSITGEHGIGVEKISFMNQLFSEHDLATMRLVRTVFNPDNRCNPGKMLPMGGHCVETTLPALRRAT